MTLEERIRNKEYDIKLLQAELKFMKAQQARKQLKPHSHNANINAQTEQ